MLQSISLNIDSKQRPSHLRKFSDLLVKGFLDDMTCTRSKTYFKNQKGGLEDGLEIKCTYMKVRRTTGQRDFFLHMLSGVVFLASISKYCMQRSRTARTSRFLGELGVLFLYTSRLHQKTSLRS